MGQDRFTLWRRIRAGGTDSPGFSTRTGQGTVVAAGREVMIRDVRDLIV
jgi:acyl CoA:acetate/3-ketoacid CoA transferase alpha subunit